MNNPVYIGKIGSVNNINTGNFKVGQKVYLDPDRAGGLITYRKTIKYRIKNFFRVILKILIWILYLMVTGKQRQMYQHAKLQDREVLDVKNDAFGSTYTTGKRLWGEEPKRDFLTWKEYRKEHNF